LRSRGERGGGTISSSGAVLEAPTLVAGLDDVTVMRETIEERGGHLWVAKGAGPFTEGEICCDDDRRTFVETADQVEQELAAGLRERKIAELVENDEVEPREIISEPPLAARSTLGF
jgi:hypothetical protein